MPNNAQEHINQIKNKNRLTYLDISNRDLGGNCSLKDFTNLKSFNSYSNQFENLDVLNSLPNKEKLEKVNFYGNKIGEVDLAQLLKNFPNLQNLNLENNPVKAINLQNLTGEQLNYLCEKIKERKFKVNSYKGTVLADLLFYIRSLIKSGDTSQNKNAKCLEGLIYQGDEVKPESSSKGVVV